MKIEIKAINKIDIWKPLRLFLSFTIKERTFERFNLADRN